MTTWDKRTKPSTETIYLAKADGDKLLLASGDNIILKVGGEWTKRTVPST